MYLHSLLHRKERRYLFFSIVSLTLHCISSPKLARKYDYFAINLVFPSGVQILLIIPKVSAYISNKIQYVIPQFFQFEYIFRTTVLAKGILDPRI